MVSLEPVKMYPFRSARLRYSHTNCIYDVRQKVSSALKGIINYTDMIKLLYAAACGHVDAEALPVHVSGILWLNQFLYLSVTAYSALVGLEPTMQSSVTKGHGPSVCS